MAASPASDASTCWPTSCGPRRSRCSSGPGWPRATAASTWDASISRRLPALLTDAGLADVGVAIHQPAHRAGPGKLLNRVTMKRITPRAVEAGLATDAEAEAVAEAMLAFCARDDTLVALPRMVQAWG